MGNLLGRGLRLLAGLAVVTGTAVVAGVAGGFMAASALVAADCECDCDGDCSSCECEREASAVRVQGRSADAEAEARRHWVDRMRERVAVVAVPAESPVGPELDPDVAPVADGESFDWCACLEYEDVDAIPGAELDDESYF